MFTLNQFLLVMLLAPLIAGLLLVAGDRRIGRGIGLGIAIFAALVAFVAAIYVSGNVLAEAPQLVSLVQIGKSALIQRLDGFSSYVIIGITALIIPALIWITTPRSAAGTEQTYSMRPMGLALIAGALAMGTVLNDNIWFSVACWALTGLVAWLIARPDPFQIPQAGEEWLDLVLITIGPILFGVLMIFPMVTVRTTSLFGMIGRSPLNFWTGLLVVLALAFSGGIYPFTLWLRRVTQGIMTEAIAVLLLLVTPISIVMLGRLLSVFLNLRGEWPVAHIGPASIPLNAILTILGLATVLVAGFVMLFERDLPIITALLGLITFGWCFVAAGVNDSHNGALIGLTLLLLSYTVGVATLLIVWSSIEWANHDQESGVQRVQGLARSLPFHALALALAGLTLIGVPLLGGFAGMAIIDQNIAGLAGAASLAGALIWTGNALALLGFVRYLSGVLGAASIFEAGAAPHQSTQREGIGLVVPLAILLLIGIAPELLLLGNILEFGPAHLAANALVHDGVNITGVSANVVGFTINNVLWLPGLFWIFAIVAALLVAVATGVFTSPAVPTPVFAGGEPLLPDATTGLKSWGDLVAIARSPFLLPGPGSWREDIGEEEEWPRIEPLPVEDEAAEEEDLVYEDESVTEEEEGDVEETAAEDEAENEGDLIETDADTTNVAVKANGAEPEPATAEADEAQAATEAGTEEPEESPAPPEEPASSAEPVAPVAEEHDETEDMPVA